MHLCICGYGLCRVTANLAQEIRRALEVHIALHELAWRLQFAAALASIQTGSARPRRHIGAVVTLFEALQLAAPGVGHCSK